MQEMSMSRVILPFSSISMNSNYRLKHEDQLLGVWRYHSHTFAIYKTLSGRVEAFIKVDETVAKVETAWIKASFPLDRSECYRGSKAWITHTPDGPVVRLMHSLLGGVREEEEDRVLEERFIKGIEAAMAHANRAKGKEIIAILGPTGAGKSVLVNQLLGVHLKKVDRKIVSANPSEEIAPIGHGPTQSQTTYASIYSRDTRPYVFADCGGFFDTRGLSTELVVTASMKMTLEAAAGVSLVLCIPYGKLEDERAGPLLRQLGLVLNHFLSDSVLAEESLLLVFTKPPEEEGVRLKREDAIEKLKEIEKSLDNGSDSKALVLFTLRDEGRFVAVYDPLDSESQRDISSRLTALRPIRSTSTAFRPAYSSIAMHKLTQRAFLIAGQGKRIFAKFREAKEAVITLEESIRISKERKSQAESALRSLHLDEDPTKASQEVNQLIASLRAVNSECQRDKENLEIRLGQAQEDLRGLKTEISSLKDKEGEDVLYWWDTAERPQTPRWQKKFPHARSFSFVARDIPAYSKVELSTTGTWIDRNEPADKKSFSITSRWDGNQRGAAEVKIYCKRKYEPAVMRAYIDLLGRAHDATENVEFLKIQIATKAASIAAANTSIREAEANLVSYEGFKAVVQELSIEKERLKKALEEAKERLRVSKDAAVRFLEGETFIETLLNICRDSQLHESEVVRDYVAALQQFREGVGISG